MYIYIHIYNVYIELAFLLFYVIWACDRRERLCTRVHVYVCILTCLYAFLHVCMCACASVCTHVHRHMCVRSAYSLGYITIYRRLTWYSLCTLSVIYSTCFTYFWPTFDRLLDPLLNFVVQMCYGYIVQQIKNKIIVLKHALAWT